LRRYETIFITLPELSEEDHSALLEKIRSIMTSWQGEVIKLDDWGVKKLGYEIRKNSRGRFFLIDYLAKPDLILELERNLRLSDRVLKYQTIKLSEEISPEAIKTLKEGPPPPEKPAVISEPPAPVVQPAEIQEKAVAEGGETK
jgi:small subunit ribosomal protein S6